MFKSENVVRKYDDLKIQIYDETFSIKSYSLKIHNENVIREYDQGNKYSYSHRHIA